MHGVIQSKRQRTEALRIDDPLEMLIGSMKADELDHKPAEGIVWINLDSPWLHHGQIIMDASEAIELATRILAAAREAT